MRVNDLLSMLCSSCTISGVQAEDVILFMQQLRWLAIETPGWKSSQLSTPQIKPAWQSSFSRQSPSPRPHKPEELPQNFQGVGVGQHLKSVSLLFLNDQHCLTAFSTRLFLVLSWETIHEWRTSTLFSDFLTTPWLISTCISKSGPWLTVRELFCAI